MRAVEFIRIPRLPLISNTGVNVSSIVRVDITHFQACVSIIKKPKVTNFAMVVIGCSFAINPNLAYPRA
jgi:hypothetical protein